MHKLKKTFYFGLATGIAVALILVMLAVAQAHYAEFQAKQLLRVLQQVKVGSTSQADVVRMIDRFRRYQHYGPPELGFDFYNTWATGLKLAAPAGFMVVITIKDGVVVRKSATEWSGAAGPVAAASVRESKRGFGYLDNVVPSNQPSRTVQWQKHDPQIAPGKVRRIIIEVDDTSPESQRSKDWSFDLSCLSQFGHGCRDAKSMLPNATPMPTDANLSSTQ